MKAILAFLERSEDPVCLEDVLHMLLRLLSRKEFAEIFVEDIQVFGGCQLFLSLLERYYIAYNTFSFLLFIMYYSKLLMQVTLYASYR